MDFTSLKTSLKVQVHPVYLLFGNDSFLINKSIQLITQAINAPDTTRLDETASSTAIIAACRTVSMFGDRRLVVVRNIADTITKDLSKYLASPNKDCILILVSNVDKEPKIKNVQLVDCNPIKDATILQQLICKQVRDAGKTITPAASSLLVNLCANNYSRINNELIKLTNLDDEKIDTNHVGDFVIATQDFQIYELGNAVCRGDIQGSNKILNNLRAQGFDEYAIFGNLLAQFKRLFFSLTTKASNDAVAQVLKCNPYAVSFARRDNRVLTPKIKTIYAQTINMEYQIKSGALTPTAAVELVVFGVIQ